MRKRREHQRQLTSGLMEDMRFLLLQEDLLIRMSHPENGWTNIIYGMTFDFAIEDSPSAFEHVLHFHNCKVAVFDRPWNRQAEFPNDNFVRCKNWNQIDNVFEEYAG